MAIPAVREKDVDYERQPESHFSDFGVQDPNAIAQENERLLSAQVRNALGLQDVMPSGVAPTGGAGASSATARLTAQTQVPRQVMPGKEEAALEEKYRQESAALEGKIAPMRGDLNRLQGEMQTVSGQMPTPPALNQVPQYQRKERGGEEMMVFAGIAMALSAIGGRAAGADIATVMNAAGSAMDGFAKGDLARVEQDIKTFNTTKQAVIDENNRMLAEYKAVLEDKTRTMQQKMQEFQIISAKYKDEIGEAAIRKGDLKFQLDRLENVRKGVNDFNLRSTTISALLEGRLASAQARTDRGGTMGLTPDGLDNTAAYYILNGRLPVGMARMGQDAQQAVINRAAEMTKAIGMSPEESAAAGPLTKQKLGAYLQFEKMRNSIQAYEKMLDLNIDVLKDLSAKVNRTGSPYANKPILWLQQNAAGDPDVAEYLFQVRTVQTEAARILSNPNLTGQLTDTATQELSNVMGSNLSHQQLEAVLNRAQADARNRVKGIDEQSQKLIAEIKDPLKRNAAAPGATGQPKRGDKNKSKSGRPMTFDGAQWVYDD